MRTRTGLLAGTLVLTLAAAFGSQAMGADSDSKVSREREMLRRTQQALRETEAQKSDLSRSKLEAEQKLQTAATELEQARGAARSAQSTLRTQLAAAQAAQAELAARLEEANRQLASASARQKETEGQLSARSSELEVVRQDLDKSNATGAACEAKNVKLFEYSQALVDRYKNKGVWEALKQKDPVLGLSNVGVENVVQEYREKLDSQKIPAASGSR